MKKIIKSISLLIVAGLGIYLNTYYYIFAFLNAGYGYISYVLSIFLKNKLKWVILKVALLAFSISMTLGAQFLSTSINEITTKTDIKKTEIIQDEIKDYQEQLKSLDNQINKYIDQQKLFGTNSNKIDRQNAEKKRDELFILIKESRNKMLSEDTKIYRPKNIYEFWAEKIKSNAPDNIRFWYQLAGSIFIALMSPVCINILSKKNKLEPIKDELSKIDKENIVKMITWNFPKIKTPKETHDEFKIINVDRPNIPVYSLKDCKMIYDKIKSIKSDNLDVIKKEVMK